MPALKEMNWKTANQSVSLSMGDVFHGQGIDREEFLTEPITDPLFEVLIEAPADSLRVSRRRSLREVSPKETSSMEMDKGINRSGNRTRLAGNLFRAIIP